MCLSSLYSIKSCRSLINIISYTLHKQNIFFSFTRKYWIPTLLAYYFAIAKNYIIVKLRILKFSSTSNLQPLLVYLFTRIYFIRFHGLQCTRTLCSCEFLYVGISVVLLALKFFNSNNLRKFSNLAPGNNLSGVLVAVFVDYIKSNKNNSGKNKNNNISFFIFWCSHRISNC